MHEGRSLIFRVVALLMAPVAYVGSVVVFDLHAFVVEPFLAFAALDVDQVGIGRHLADAIGFPLLRRRKNLACCHLELCPTEVHVFCSCVQSTVLLQRHYHALPLQGLHKEAKFDSGGEHLSRRQMFANRIQHFLGQTFLAQTPLDFDEGQPFQLVHCLYDPHQLAHVGSGQRDVIKFDVVPHFVGLSAMFDRIVEAR